MKSQIQFSAIALTLGLLASMTQANELPLTDPSADDLRALLNGPVSPATRSFTRTAPPNYDGACTPPNSNAGRAQTQPSVQTAVGVRTLTVVPYGTEDAPSANLAVQFSSGSDKILEASQKTLNRLAGVLNEPELSPYRFAIAGHTDATGDPRVNLELSCARALAVRQYLIKRGIAASRLGAYGFGSAKPLQVGVKESVANRRVAIRRAD